jgi:hypothetical protein
LRMRRLNGFLLERLEPAQQSESPSPWVRGRAG